MRRPFIRVQVFVFTGWAMAVSGCASTNQDHALELVFPSLSDLEDTSQVRTLVLEPGTQSGCAPLVSGDALPQEPAYGVLQETSFPASESGQGPGRVVDSAPSPDGGCEALVVVETDIAGSADLRLGDADGPALTFLDLPYPFEETASVAGR